MRKTFIFTDAEALTMLQQTHLKLTKLLVGLSLPVFVGIGILLLLLVGATTMMM